MFQARSWVPVVFYVFTSIVYGMLASQFWLLANHLYDPRQAKRLFGVIGGGALLGGILGGQIARFASDSLGTGSVLLVAAVLLGIVAILISRVHRADETHQVQEPSDNKFDRARGGFEILRQSKPLQSIAAVVILTIMVAQIVDLQFNWAVEQSISDLDQATAFFGNFFSVMGICAFVFQMAFTSRILRVSGIGFALRVLPVTMGVGTIALFIAAGFFPEMLITAAIVLKVGETGLRYSIDQATLELLFMPIPSSLRVKAKAFIDVFIQRGAKGLSALLLLPVTFGLITVVDSGWISLVLIAVWLVVSAVAAREYVRAFRQGLKGRTADSEIVVDLTDVTTLELLIESLGSSDKRQVVNSLEILVGNGRGDLVPPLLLYHDEPKVRLKTLLTLSETGRMDVGALIEKRLGDVDPEVRAEAIRVLAGIEGKNISELMLPKLNDKDAGVRAAAVACLSNFGDKEMIERADQVLIGLLTDAEADVRCEAAKAIGSVHEPRFREHLIRLLYDREDSVVGESISAIRRRVERDGFNPLYVPTLVSLLKNRRVKHEAKEALVAFGEPAIPALVHFMNDPEEPIWVRRALPKAIAEVGTQAAAEALLDGLDTAEDAFHRRKLVEALGSLTEYRSRLGQRLDRIEVQIREEARRYLDNVSNLIALGLRDKGRFIGPLVEWDGVEVPTLLDRLVEQKAADNLRNLFGLLALVYGPNRIWPAYVSLTADSVMLRARALEFLDNTLEGEIKRNVFAVIDDAPLAEKLERAQRQFEIQVRSKTDTLKAFLRSEEVGDTDEAALAVLALYAAHQERESHLEKAIAGLQTTAVDPFVQETASWVAMRMGIASGQ
jgi:AAA family ATP:ADP antiporter